MVSKRHGQESGVTIVPSPVRPAGVKAIKEAKKRRGIEERKSEVTKMREAIDRSNDMWAEDMKNQDKARQVESIVLATSVLEKGTSAYKSLEKNMLKLVGER